ncbi:MAG: DegV family protein [Actinobacteria bacterium]|nr:DegV family protein [Actinomycetota bacterium]
MPVAVVTDSAADLPADVAVGHRVEVVPLVVTFEGDSRRSGVDISAEDFWRRARTAFPTTASPPPAAFAEAYSRSAEAGADGVVSVHLSGELSGTAQNARAAAGRARVPVRVIDSRLVGAGLGLAVLQAADAAAAGGGLEEVAGAAEAAAALVEVYVALETVEFLRRGGRLGAARAMLSDLLRVRPVLTLEGGVPVPVAKARTRRRALDELVARASGPARAAAVSHGDAPDAEALATRLEEACGVRPSVTLMGAALGAHLGPGALGLAVLRPSRPDPP